MCFVPGSSVLTAVSAGPLLPRSPEPEQEETEHEQYRLAECNRKDVARIEILLRQRLEGRQPADNRQVSTSASATTDAV